MWWLSLDDDSEDDPSLDEEEEICAVATAPGDDVTLISVFGFPIMVLYSSVAAIYR